MTLLNLTDAEIAELITKCAILRDPHECDHRVVRPTKTIWNAPGHPIHGKSGTVCVSCETSKTVKITPFEFPILQVGRPNA
jgi:hypothetical protein